ncbi:hypothetical protein BDFG_09217, partial [Blastomyces dermatitidis ATCC 26199]
IELLEVTISEIKLSPGSSLNDHMESYITVLTGKRDSVATAVRGAENELNIDAPAGRRDDTSLHDTATTTTAARDAEEREDVTMRAVLPRLIDIISTINLAFLVIMKAAAASQRHLLTRKCQNKFLIVLQE